MTYRIIYSLSLELVQPADAPPRQTGHLIVPLQRDGMPAGPAACTNGLPRPPKRRTIDLRAGDQVLVGGVWRTVKGVSAYRDCWLTAEQAAKQAPDGDGYLYCVRGGTDAACVSPCGSKGD